MAWATVERLPYTTLARLTAVERTLGMRVAASSLSTPTPGVYRAQDVMLTNVETGTIVLTADVATMRTTGSLHCIELDGVGIAADQLHAVAEVAQRLLKVDWPADVVIQAVDARWIGDVPSPAHTLLDGGTVCVWLRTNETDDAVLGRALSVRLGPEKTGPQLAVDRNRQVSPPATRVTVSTAGESIPANWIAQLGGFVAGGDSSTASFVGEASITHGAGGTSGDLTGMLEGVSLASVTQLPIDTTASIRSLTVKWDQDHVTNAEGVVVGGAGTMAGQVAEMVQPLLYNRAHMQPATQMAADGAVEFGKLAVSFVLDEQSLTLWGACGGDPNQAPCMLGTAGNVLFGPPNYRVSLAGVSTLLAHLGAEHAGDIAARLPRNRRR